MLAYIGRKLHIVEIKAPTHKFGNADFDRMARYVRAFREFEAKHAELVTSFPDGWQIDLVADSVNITDPDKAESFKRFEEQDEVHQVSWAVPEPRSHGPRGVPEGVRHGKGQSQTAERRPRAGRTTQAPRCHAGALRLPGQLYPELRGVGQPRRQRPPSPLVTACQRCNLKKGAS